MTTIRTIKLIGFIAIFGASVFAQKPAAGPRQEKLLNGLKVLVWNNPGADKVTLKLRFHECAYFIFE